MNFHTCNSCLCAQKDQRDALDQALLVASDLLLVALSHDHAVTFRPGTDSYDLKVEIEPVREEDTIDRGPRDVSIDLNAMARSIR